MPSRRHRVSHNRNLSSGTDRAAGDTPAHLPDDKCGPVVIRRINTPLLEEPSSEPPQEPSLLDRAADRIEELTRSAQVLEEVRLSLVGLLDAADARIAELNARLTETSESLECANARIIELEEEARDQAVRLQRDARGHDRLAALLDTPA